VDAFASSDTVRVLRFAPGYVHVPVRGRPGVVRSSTAELPLPAVPRSLEMLLHRLPLGHDQVISEAVAVGPPALEILQALAAAGALEDAVVGHAMEDLAVAQCPTPQVGCAIASRCVRLGEHVFVRPLPAKWLVMRPSTPTTISLGSEVAGSVLCSLAAGCDAKELSQLGKLFLDNGFLMGDEQAAHFPWEFHDALFHGATANGYGTDGGYGATSSRAALALKQGSDPVPATNGRMIDLADERTCPPGMDILARRRTRRDFSARPVPLHSLNSLLGLALRTQSVTSVSPTDQYALHPYPSGGARDEITTLIARAHDEEEAFLSLYLNREHKLFRYHQSQEQARETIETLSAVCQVAEPGPSVALLFAADYERMASRYEAIAYATILRNIGAIYQTVCLAAEALELGTCAVGGGWGHLERQTLSGYLGNKVIVGGILVGVPAGQPGHEKVPV
jgi:SagB-type dehydrogenase family enzyme